MTGVWIVVAALVIAMAGCELALGEYRARSDAAPGRF